MNFSIRDGAGAWARRKSRDELKGANIRGEDNDAGCLNFSIRGGAGAEGKGEEICLNFRDELKEQI